MESALTRLLPDRIGLVVRLVARAGMRPTLLDAVHRYTDRLAEEPGTEAFLISLDPGDTDVVWLQEVFHDEDAVAQHRAAPAFGELMHELGEVLVDGPAVLRLQPLRLHLGPGLMSPERDLEI